MNRSEYSGHLDNDTLGWSQGILSTQVPLYQENYTSYSAILKQAIGKT